MIPLPTIAKIKNYYYDTKNKLGSGGYASVYKAYKDSDPKTPYALKIIDLTGKKDQEKLSKNIKREIELLSNIKSENVIKLLDHIVESKGPKIIHYLVLEYGDEGTLEQKLQQSPLIIDYEDKKGKKHSVRYLEESEVVQIMLQIAKGFQYLEAENIIHRDLKPSNIVFKNSIAKIIDLDFAKCLDEKETPAIGTVGYKSPEIIKGKWEKLSKCDVWSFGIMIFELLYGRLPFLPKTNVDFQFFAEFQKGIKTFPINPKVSIKMKQLILDVLVFKSSRRPNWNEVCMRMDELGFCRKISTPIRKKGKKPDISIYYTAPDKRKERKCLKEEMERGNSIVRDKGNENCLGRSQSLCNLRKNRQEIFKINGPQLNSKIIKKKEEFQNQNEDNVLKKEKKQK